MDTEALASLLQWLREAPPNTLVDAAAVADLIAGFLHAPDTTPGAAPEPTWPEKFWTIAPHTRIGPDELLEALRRPASWLYRHTSPKSGCPRIPHRKLDGKLVFVVGEVRQWLIEREEVIVEGHTSPSVVPIKRKASDG